MEKTDVMKKKLPIGIQSFINLRSENYMYVDKTEHIYNMIANGRIYFLSRPRRFGKSLLVSTLDALFRGRKELFEGLFIYDKWDWTKHYPVVRLDFGGRSFDSPEELKVSLDEFIDEMAEDYAVNLRKTNLSDKFSELLKKVHQSAGEQVVFLVDEYDKPVVDHLSNKKILEVIKVILHGFYQVLKAADDHIKFVFLTGVSKFSGLSVFSALNNLSDITLHEDFATICGYTQEELECYFTDYIADIAEHKDMSRNELLDAVKYWYNGYSWDGKTSVYNPFSTLLFLSNRRFDNYWFRTGTPTFLIKLLKSRNQIKPVLESIETDSSVFESYDTECLEEIPLLFQTGYLTIKQVTTIQQQEIYSLGVPDSEVKIALTRFLFNAYSNYSLTEIQSLILNIHRQIYDGDTSALEQNMRMALARIPNILHVDKEKYYHSLFILFMEMLGFDILGEIQTNIGRIDAVWHQPGLTVIAEIKYHSKTDIDNLLEEAMTQIRDRKYYEAYLDKKVMLMAVAFTGKEVKCMLNEV